jgi:hypothetical protein
MSLREVLVGMIEEYARHMGHVNPLREGIAGGTILGNGSAVAALCESYCSSGAPWRAAVP